MNQDNEPTSTIDYQALAELRYQIRCFLRFSEQAARATGIEPQQYQLLLAIKGLPVGRKPTIGDLAERLQIQHNSTVELINRLAERDLIKRERDANDQRQILITLTRHGEDILQHLALHHQTELQTIGPALQQALASILAHSSPATHEQSHTQERDN